jgi:protein-tyrosine sulfotransferase
MTDPDPGGPARPIFVIGAMGSGTTLLRLMLDSHQNIAIPEETGFMRIYNAYRWTPFKYSGGETMERLGWTPEELDILLAQHFDRLFMNYAEQHGKRRWGEKSPLHTWHVPNMARLFPHAQFVMIMRHPAASVHSNLRRFTRYASNPGEPRKHWNWYGRLIAQHAVLLGDRMTFIRYEHLVLQPERAVGELLEWLGEPPSDAVLRHHEVQAGRGGNPEASGKSRVDEPIDTSRIDRWRSSLPQPEQNRIAERLGPLARFFGYDVRDPFVLEPLHDSDALLTSGPQLAARIELFPELDLMRSIGLPNSDRLHDPRNYVAVDSSCLLAMKEHEVQATTERPTGVVRRLARVILPVAVRRRILRLKRWLGERR